jgi:hypothetical protein
MTGKFLIRSIGVLTCLAVVASGWDAEAGWRRHRHHREACCYEPVCCEPVRETVCCEPVREAVCCEPVRETVCCEPVYRPACCETVIVPVATCCNGLIVANEAAPSGQVSVMKPAPGQQATAAGGTKATATALKR